MEPDCLWPRAVADGASHSDDGIDDLVGGDALELGERGQDANEGLEVNVTLITRALRLWDGKV